MAIAPSLTVLVSLVSRENILFTPARSATFKPVNLLTNPRSIISWAIGNCSGKNTCLSHNSNSIDRKSSGISLSLKISRHATPSIPITALNPGSPAAPANINVVPSVPKNFVAASALVRPFIGLIISLKFLTKNVVTCNGYMVNCNAILPIGPCIIKGRLYVP